MGKPRDLTLTLMGRKPAAPFYEPGETLELLPLAAPRPTEALARARAILAQRPSHDASVARQAVGTVLRDFGDVRAAIRELRTALRLATAAGSQDRQADVLAMFGLALIQVGRTTPGLSALDAAARQATGALAGRVRYRRGGALWLLGRHREALYDLRRASGRTRISAAPNGCSQRPARSWSRPSQRTTVDWSPSVQETCLSRSPALTKRPGATSSPVHRCRT